MTRTLGMELMERIHEGSIEVSGSKAINDVKAKIVENLDEIIEIGARVRPLYIGDSRIGWVRGLYSCERKQIVNWYGLDNEALVKMLSISTTLDIPDIKNLDRIEIRSLLSIISSMSEADVSLYPYIQAYVSTSNSESLWFSRDRRSGNTRIVDTLDSKSLKIINRSEHERLWASLCSYREQAKSRLDLNYSSAMIASAFAGKSGASKLYNSLNKISKELDTNREDLWKKHIKMDIKEKSNLDDGWAHSHEDDSEEGLMREFKGFINSDRHDRFMQEFYERQMQDEQNRIIESEKKFQKAVEEDNLLTESVSIIQEDSNELNRKKKNRIVVD